MTASALPVAASAIFKKKSYLTAISQPCYDVLIILSSQHIVWLYQLWKLLIMNWRICSKSITSDFKKSGFVVKPCFLYTKLDCRNDCIEVLRISSGSLCFLYKKSPIFLKAVEFTNFLNKKAYQNCELQMSCHDLWMHNQIGRLRFFVTSFFLSYLSYLIKFVDITRGTHTYKQKIYIHQVSKCWEDTLDKIKYTGFLLNLNLTSYNNISEIILIK